MSLATDSATELADKSGFLELRGFKHKLFVVVAGDKVFLYKNAEVGCWGGCGTMGDPNAVSRGDPFPFHCQPEQSRSEPGHSGLPPPLKWGQHRSHRVLSREPSISAGSEPWDLPL